MSNTNNINHKKDHRSSSTDSKTSPSGSSSPLSDMHPSKHHSPPTAAQFRKTLAARPGSAPVTARPKVPISAPHRPQTARRSGGGSPPKAPPRAGQYSFRHRENIREDSPDPQHRRPADPAHHKVLFSRSFSAHGRVTPAAASAVAAARRESASRPMSARPLSARSPTRASPTYSRALEAAIPPEWEHELVPLPIESHIVNPYQHLVGFIDEMQLKPLTSNPTLLIRVYIRIKLWTRAWRKRFRENHGGSNDGGACAASTSFLPEEVPQDLRKALTDLDSPTWLQIVQVDSVLVEGSADHETMHWEERTVPKRAVMRISASHVHFNSHGSPAHWLAFRLCNMLRVVQTSDTQLTITLGVSQSPIALIHTDLAWEEHNSLRVSFEIVGDTPHLMAKILLGHQSRAMHNQSAAISRVLKARHDTRKLHVVHFNDVYHLTPFKPAGTNSGLAGGAARFHTMLSTIREEHNPLVLFSGDFMGPSLMSVLTKGRQMVDALNFLGVHYGCYGNHEFDYGMKALKDAVFGSTHGSQIFAGSQTVWIMSNMTEADGTTPLGGAKQYATCIWNNVRVGLLGLCENWLPTCPKLRPDEAVYHDIFERGESLARFLKDKGCEIVLAITHNRLPLDREVTARCPSIDYLLGGHDHFFKNEPNHRLIKSGQEFEFLTFLEFEFQSKALNKVKVDSKPVLFTVEESEYMKNLIQRYEHQMATKLGRPIGMSSIPLDSTEETMRFREGHLTNFLMDIVESESGADFAVMGAAAFGGKEVKPPSAVTIGDVFNWFPNETRMMTVALKGSTIGKLLTAMVKDLPEENPSFPHPSKSLSFTIRTNKLPATVSDIYIKGEPLDMERIYTVAVEVFAGIGKARYKMIPAEGTIIVGEEDAPHVAYWVLDWFRNRKGQARSGEDTQREHILQLIHRVAAMAARIEIDADEGMTLTNQQMVTSLISKLINCDRCSVFLLDNRTDELYFFPNSEQPKTVLRFSKKLGVAGFVACNGDTVNIEDAYQDSRFNPAIDKKTGYRTRSIIAAPVRLGRGDIIAVVQAINKIKDGDMHGGNFDDVDELVLRLIGEQVGFQLRHGEIYRDASHYQEEEQVSSSSNNALISQHTTTTFDDSNGPIISRVPAAALAVFRELIEDPCIDTMVLARELSNVALKVIPADRVLVVTADMAAGHLRTLHQEDDGEDVFEKIELAPGTILNEVLRTMDLFVDNSASGKELSVITTSEDENQALNLKSVLAAPIVTSADEKYGAIIWINKRGRSHGGGHPSFTRSDELSAKYTGLFAAVSLQSASRLEGLSALKKESAMQAVPVQPLGRIQTRGGWATIRESIKDIAAWRKEGKPLDKANKAGAMDASITAQGPRVESLKQLLFDSAFTVDFK